MENEKSNIEKGELTKYPLPKRNKRDELYETISEKLSWVSKDYRNVINGESESDEKITEKDIYEANLSDIEKRFDKNSREYKIFQTLRRKGLKIYINPKTDVSYTDRYNIIRGLGPITEQSKSTMELGSDTPDETVYMTKLIHEMGHSIITYNIENHNELTSKNASLLSSIRTNTGISITKLASLDRYDDMKKKVTDDTAEFIRMYIQNPTKFKEYLNNILKDTKPAELVINTVFSYIEEFVKNFLDDNIDIEK